MVTPYKGDLMKTLLVALLLGIASFQTLAQPAAVIDGVQMPAWLERDGKRTPLAPGMELRAGDRVTTGDGSRVLVKLAEGSVVKLGENGRLVFSEMQPGKDLFKATLQILEGAFRFTTELVGKGRKREVNVRVSQVTAGIRGTDFWGRSRAGRQIVCLIEGAIDVGADGEQAVRLDKPLQFYQRDKGKTQPVGNVEPAQIAQWGRETEIEEGKGAARRGGRFSVVLAEADNRAAVLAVHEKVREAGYPSQIAQRKEGDQIVYAVRIRQLASRAEAQALADQLKGKLGVKEPRIAG
jgi:hypothetical protein